MDSSESPRLPMDLEREIFELAAFLHPQCTLSLVLVAQRVKIWIDPMRFRTLSIHDGWSGFSRLPLFTVTKLVKFYPQALDHTRNVFFNIHYPLDVAADFLSRCESVVNLAFIGPMRMQHPELVLEDHPLERLSFPLTAFQQLFPYPDPFDGSHSIFSRITLRELKALQWSALKALRCSAVTHLRAQGTQW
ncbi:hypothetical protein MSAN_00242300 [Mycena sanguinolenta]|uniref:Uncharacterized protein n=1 Tax=Mycena sanguinolenta TaxID=230812 RepID=A0A8H7DMU6_9AGAR|nr:hypothetical protein MSAN_00242300 [Mycena sanguinolenta]